VKIVALLPAILILVSVCGSPVPPPGGTPTRAPELTAAAATATPRRQVAKPVPPPLPSFPRTPRRTATPTPTARPDLTNVPTCSAADLRASWTMEQAWTSRQSTALVTLTNITEGYCLLDGVPDIVLTSEDGVPATLHRNDACFPGLSCPGHVTPLLEPAPRAASQDPSARFEGVASFEIGWSNNTDGGKCERPAIRYEVSKIILADGSSMELDVYTGVRTDDTPVPMRLSLGPWCRTVRVGSLRQGHQTFLGGQPYPVSLSMAVGGPVGDQREVSIVITNKTNSILTFDDPCPIATIEVAFGHPGEPGYQYTARQRAPLDCRSQPDISPNGSASFSYLIRYPPDLPNQGVGWSIAWYVGDGTDQSSRLPGPQCHC
jgi:hypothetical protein